MKSGQNPLIGVKLAALVCIGDGQELPHQLRVPCAYCLAAAGTQKYWTNVLCREVLLAGKSLLSLSILKHVCRAGGIRKWPQV